MTKKHTVRVSQAGMLGVGQYLAATTGRAWFLIGDTGRVCDAVGRHGWEQCPQLEIKPDGECVMHEANPRQPKEE